ncbi:MAG: CpaF family protein [Gammaproteobacteria bacterium]|nr:CpaF family protein [Gammaproteobacteria bacterium]
MNTREPAPHKPPHDGRDAGRHAVRSRIHARLLDRLDLSALENLAPAQIRFELEQAVQTLLAEESLVLPRAERDKLVEDIFHEVTGLGPLDSLLADPGISDILVNNAAEVYVERGGLLQKVDVTFNDDAHLMRIINKIVTATGRRIDESSPMVDTRLADGSRVNAIIPPLSVKGPTLSIRRFAIVPYTMESLVGIGSLSPAMASLMRAMVRAKINLLIVGGTGSGKTTLLNALSGFIPADERILTIEDAAELRLQQPHVVSLETRPPNVEGKGGVAARELVRNALRMRPDRIVVGEVRGDEVIDMLQAMNTGHEGSMTTVHANSPVDALVRLENIIGMSGISIPYKPLRQQICSAIQAIIEIERMSDGKRRVVSVQEVIGLEGDEIRLREIFAFRQSGVDEQGGVVGHHVASGALPGFLKKIRTRGEQVADEIFQPEGGSGP